MGGCSHVYVYSGIVRVAMKIVLDLRSVHAGMSGIGRYALNLCLSLLTSERGLIVEGITSTSGKDLIEEQARIRLHIVKHKGEMWDELSLPDLLRSVGADLYHTPLFVLPTIRTCKYVCTVHDVIPVVRPDLTHESFAQFFHTHIGRAFRSAHHVIAVSEYSKQDVLKSFHVDEARISAIHEAVSPVFLRTPSSEDEARLRPLSLKPGYILSVGAADRRKNLAGLLDAYRLLGRSGTTPPLAIVGGASGDAFDLAAEVRMRDLGSQVRLLGRVPDDLLATLYSHAALLAFPSLYEGFGLPVVEAMAAGTPVVTSQVSSLPEIAGDAALLVDPLSPNALKDAMRRILEDKNLRADLIRKGRVRVKQFSPETHGDRLADLYRRVLGAVA
jgi:glycosyltransferase involved in cell wall biosynthesis